jgi:glucose-1-phosphate thymidylyltransferase
MKVVIPVAGKGTRLKPHTFTHPKALIPLAGKPILGHILDKLIEAGVDEFVLVVGYLGDKVRKYVETAYSGIKVHYVYQKQSEGIGHAIWLCSEFLEGEQESLIVLGDSVLEYDVQSLRHMNGNILGVKKVDDPSLFGVAEIDQQSQQIKRLVEKPRIPKSNVALVGLYLIRDTKRLLDVLDQHIGNDKRSYEEFQLTDALMQMIDEGQRFTAFEVKQWFDCGQRDILLETNAIMLRREPAAMNPTQAFENTILIPPVSIHPESKISNAIIGPNVSVAAHAVIDRSIVRDSIIGGNATIKNIILTQSLIGNDSIVYGNNQQLNIGDSTEINFGG